MLPTIRGSRNVPIIPARMSPSGRVEATDKNAINMGRDSIRK